MKYNNNILLYPFKVLSITMSIIFSGMDRLEGAFSKISDTNNGTNIN